MYENMCGSYVVHVNHVDLTLDIRHCFKKLYNMADETI